MTKMIKIFGKNKEEKVSLILITIMDMYYYYVIDIKIAFESYENFLKYPLKRLEFIKRTYNLD